MDSNNIITFGDVRRMIIDTIIQLREDKMDVSRGMAIAANMKALNDSVQVEINAAKVAMTAHEKGHNFGRVVSMGQKVIGSDSSQQP